MITALAGLALVGVARALGTPDGLRFEVVDHPMFDKAVVAFIGTKRVGAIGMNREDGAMAVSYGNVSSDYRRMGIYTALIRKAAEVACGDGLVLMSDTSQTPEAKMVWQQLRAHQRFIISCGGDR